jgi:hypothetical protein
MVIEPGAESSLFGCASLVTAIYSASSLRTLDLIALCLAVAGSIVDWYFAPSLRYTLAGRIELLHTELYDQLLKRMARLDAVRLLLWTGGLLCTATAAFVP